jgi:hypothetical protein
MKRIYMIPRTDIIVMEIVGIMAGSDSTHEGTGGSYGDNTTPIKDGNADDQTGGSRAKYYMPGFDE